MYDDVDQAFFGKKSGKHIIEKYVVQKYAYVWNGVWLAYLSSLWSTDYPANCPCFISLDSPFS